MDYSFTGSCGDRFDAVALSLWHSHDGHRLCLGQHRVAVCLAFLCQPYGGLFLVAVSQGHHALCAGSFRRDGDDSSSHERHQQSMASAVLPYHHRRIALLRRHACGACEDFAGVCQLHI